MSSRHQVRRTPRHAIVLGAVLVFTMSWVALGPTAAQASRKFDSHFGKFNGTTSVAFDAAGDAWVSDGGNPPHPSEDGIYKYDPYPSQTLLTVPNTEQAIGGVVQIQLAVDQATGEVFAASENPRLMAIFNNEGVYTGEWSGINGHSCVTFDCVPYMRVAIDNTNTYSEGRIYLSLAGPENDIEVFDNGQRPVDFPATASYISGNKLTGTPNGPFGSVGPIAVDSKGNLFVNDVEEGVIDEFDSTGTFIRSFPGPGGGNAYQRPGLAVDPMNGNLVLGTGEEIDESGNFLGSLEPDEEGGSHTGAPAFNAQGYLYIPTNAGFQREDVVDIYKPDTPVAAVEYHPVASQTATSGTLTATVSPNGSGNVTSCMFEYGTTESYGSTETCSPDAGAGNFSTPTEVTAQLSGLTTGTTYHYRVVVESAGGKKYGTDQTYTPQGVIGLTTEAASEVGESEATLNGSLLGTGTPTHYFFEWGPTSAYGETSAAAPGTSAGSPSGPSRTQLSFHVAGLIPYSTYHYRVVATDGSGTSYGEDRMFTTPPGAPDISAVSVTAVHSDRALMHANIDPNGTVTTYKFEYVDDASFQGSGWADAQTVTPEEPDVGMSREIRAESTLASGLEQGTGYHFRAVATNFAGSDSAEGSFRTFPFLAFSDPCKNAHVRQQTGSAQLLDCRAYELASAADTGGYDVESNLDSGTPFAGYPQAEGPSRVLYSVHSGAIAGTGDPTNHGIDPYVATRTESGWTTKYVGIPASGTPSAEAFGSQLLEANGNLETFAFGGSICSPCFGDGSTGIPVHTPDGALVQGMTGSIAQPSAEPAGYIGKSISADGSHLVFGSTSQFEPDGNSNGDISIYDRDLTAGITHVVSKTPGGATMTGAGIGELDISSDGSHIVVGQLVSTDSAGNRYWHLYMNIGDSDHTIDLTPGAADGALFDGMTADGSRVFFTTADRLTSEDTDSSADIYEMDLTNPSAPKLSLVSGGPGGAGNSDSCDPAANSRRPHWNSVEGVDCDAVAISGGGGVAAVSGDVYFLSPELLDGPSNGVQNAPNLYVRAPGGAPRFVATLESSANAPLPLAVHPFQRYFGSFEKPGGVAIDPVDGSVYVLDISGSTGGAVEKFDSAGNPVTSFGDHGRLTGANTPAETLLEYGLLNLPTEIAVDDDPSSPSYRDLYVPDFTDGVVDKFDPNGNYVSQLQTGAISTVAVDPTTGRVYVGRYYESTVGVYSPTGAELNEFAVFDRPTGLAIDPSTDSLYVANGGGAQQKPGKTEVYNLAGELQKVFTGHPSMSVSVDPTDGHVYVDEGNQVSEFESSGSQVGHPIGAGQVSESISVDAYGGHVAAANAHGGNVALFGTPEIPENNLTDSPMVLDSVHAAATRKTADFQVTPSGSYAVFPSALSLTGYESVGHREVFRYDSGAEAIECLSCNSTSEQATGEASLAANGLSLTDDGRVFFNAEEGLVDRDLNEKEDAYEWEKLPGESEGKVQLISTGTSILPASLLGASADGVDAYFFTHQTLVASDLNGGRVKLYDARENGGFPFVPAEVPCQASDECHGAGSPTPPLPTIPSTAGTPAASSARPHTKRHKHHTRHHHRRPTHRKGHHD